MFPTRQTLLPLGRAALLTAATAVAGLVGSCGQVDLLTPEEAALVGDVLGMVKIAPDTVAFDGERHIERFEGEFSTLLTAHIERVQADGQGGFNIDPLQVLQSGAISSEQLLILEDSRVGWNWRFRDFRIHDIEAALQNYSILSFGESTTVAGRACQHLDVAITWDPFTILHSIDVDVQTGLVLRHEVLENQDQLRYRSEYTSISFTDLEPFVPHTLHTEFEEFASIGDLEDDLGFELQVPRTLPDGFHRQQFGKLADSPGSTWGLVQFTDGIEPLFLLSRPRIDPTGRVPDPKIAGVGVSVSKFDAPTSESDGEDLMSGRVEGALSILQADLGAQRLIAVGRVPMVELRYWLDSAPH